jgi:hypothetical protein
MNRVDPLREGSGECIALIGVDACADPKFKRFLKIFANKIRYLLTKLYRRRYKMERLGATRNTAPRRG